MLIDSHCHLNFKELSANLPGYLDAMAKNKVDFALCVATRPDNIDEVVNIARNHDNLFAAVGIHPDEKLADFSLDKDYLLKFTTEPKVIAIGETGLDYYRNKDQELNWQHERFRIHIQAAKAAKLPLVVHTREAVADTVHMLSENGGIKECGAVIHCFTEDIKAAREFLDLGCYISLSGIVTFKNAAQVHEAAKYVPLDRLLVETDAPFLAPVPYRGKINHPALVLHTAQYIADLRHISLAELAKATTENFFNLFQKAQRNYTK